jgi:hypothetical protein
MLQGHFLHVSASSQDLARSLTYLFALCIILLHSLVILPPLPAGVDPTQQPVTESLLLIVALKESRHVIPSSGSSSRETLISSLHGSFSGKSLGSAHLRERGSVVNVCLRVRVERSIAIVIADREPWIAQAARESSLDHVVIEEIFAFLVLVFVVPSVSCSASCPHLIFLVVTYIFLIVEVRERRWRRGRRQGRRRRRRAQI